MTAVEAAAPAMGTAPACVVLGLPRATLYRRRRPLAVPLPRPAPPRALDAVERQAVLDTLHSERFLDHAPAQIHATLLDEGTYLCSPADDVPAVGRSGRDQGTTRSGPTPTLRRA